MNYKELYLFAIMGCVAWTVMLVIVTIWVPAEQTVYYDEGFSDGKVAINGTDYIRCASYAGIGEPNSNPINYVVFATSTAHQDQNKYKYCKGFVDGYAQQNIGSEVLN